MKLRHLTNLQSACFKPGANDTSIVFCTWLRLFRNLKGFNFLPAMAEDEKARLNNFLIEKFTNELTKYKLTNTNLNEIEPIDLLLLKERALVHSLNYKQATNSSLMMNTKEDTSILTNDSEHLCFQVTDHGLNAAKLWAKLDHLDEDVSQSLQYTYNDKFGYLASDINKTGTGLQIDILMHLPALVFTGKIHKKIQEISATGLKLISYFNNKQFPIGNLFVLSNTSAIGQSEMDLIELLETTALSISLEEKSLRDSIYKNSQSDIIDKIQRAFGLLSHTNQISFQEAYTYLSIIKLGIDLDVLPFLNNQTWFRIFLNCQDAHIQELNDTEMENKEIEMERAKLLSSKLKPLEP